MSNRRYGVIWLRVGLAASLFTALFWLIWSLFVPVPDHGTLQFSAKTSWTIPLSRWWDIPAAFLLVNVYAWTLRGWWFLGKAIDIADDVLVFGLIASLAAGLAAGLGASLFVGPGAASLFVGLGAILFVSLGATLFVSLAAGLAAGLKYLFFCKLYGWLYARDVK